MRVYIYILEYRNDILIFSQIIQLSAYETSWISPHPLSLLNLLPGCP